MKVDMAVESEALGRYVLHSVSYKKIWDSQRLA